MTDTLMIDLTCPKCNGSGLLPFPVCVPVPDRIPPKPQPDDDELVAKWVDYFMETRGGSEIVTEGDIQDIIKEARQGKQPNDLVEKIYELGIASTWGDRDKYKAEIRKLLQGDK